MSLKEISGLVDDLKKNKVGNEIMEHRVHDMHSCDCVGLDKETQDLIESDAHWPMEDNTCGPIRSADEVEAAIQWWIGFLGDVGYYEEDAERAVFDALAALVESNIIPDCPEYDVPTPEKNVWIERFNTQIKVRLVSMGIELNG